MSDICILQWLGIGINALVPDAEEATDNIGGEIQLMRGPTRAFAGLPHRYIEQYGGKPVQLSFYAPDPMTFRDGFYYHSRENQLYKKFLAGSRYVWKAVGE